MRLISSKVAVWALAAAVLARCRPGPRSKIGVVDYSRLLEESPQAKAAARGDAHRIRAACSASCRRSSRPLKAKQDKLQKDGATMTEDQRQRAEKDLRDGERDLAAQAARKSRTTSTRGATRRCRACSARSIEEVRTYAKAQNFDLVIADGVIYADADARYHPGDPDGHCRRTAPRPPPGPGDARADAGHAGQVSAAAAPLSSAAAQVSQPWPYRSGSSRSASAASCAAIRTRASSGRDARNGATPARSASSPIPRYRAQLERHARHRRGAGCGSADACPVAALVAANPYATFARIADAAAIRGAAAPPGVHPIALSSRQSAHVDPTAQVGALAVIGAQRGHRAARFDRPALHHRSRAWYSAPTCGWSRA